MAKRPTKQDLESARRHGAEVKALYSKLKPIVDGQPGNVVLGAVAEVLAFVIAPASPTLEKAYVYAGRFHGGLCDFLEELYANEEALSNLKDGPKH